MDPGNERVIEAPGQPMVQGHGGDRQRPQAVQLRHQPGASSARFIWARSVLRYCECRPGIEEPSSSLRIEARQTPQSYSGEQTEPRMWGGLAAS